MYDHTFLNLQNHQLRHQTTHKVGCQPGDFIGSFYNLPRGLCGYIRINILTLSPPRVHGYKDNWELAWVISFDGSEYCSWNIHGLKIRCDGAYGLIWNMFLLTDILAHHCACVTLIDRLGHCNWLKDGWKKISMLGCWLYIIASRLINVSLESVPSERCIT